MSRRTDVKSQGRSRFTHFDPDIASTYDDEDVNDFFQTHSSYYRNKDKSSCNISKEHDDRKFKKDSLAKSGHSTMKQVMFRVVVKGCNQCSIDEIITEIQGYTTPFLPYFSTRAEKSDVQFYVKDAGISTSLQQLSRRIKNPRTKTNLLIMTTKTTCLWNKLPFGHREIIESVCKSRLSNDGKTLDLSNFSSDPYFESRGITVSLQKIEVLITVMDFVFKSCSELTNLAVKNTGLRRLDSFASMIYAIPMIKVLDLSSNNLEKMSELGRIRLWKIEELFLNNTGAVNVFTKDSEYLRIVKGYFPYLKILDGISLDSGTDEKSTDDETDIVVKPGFCSSPDIKKVLETFISQYFDIFDGPDGRTSRKQLTEAYDENAVFSLVYEVIDDGNHVRMQKSKGKLHEPDSKIYRNISHNIIRENKWCNFRKNTYGKGNLEILAMLCRLPIANHIRESFVMDICMVTDKVVIFTLQGMFNDGESHFTSLKSKDNLKYFTRSFVCLPRGVTALSIISDILTIHPLNQGSVSQYEAYCLKLKNQSPINDISKVVSDLSSNLENTSTSNQTSTSSVNNDDPEIRNAMVKSFMEQSGMSEIWSKRCLEDSSWNYSLAGDRFLSIKNSIPAEAFKK